MHSALLISPLTGISLILLSTLTTAIYFTLMARLMRSYPAMSSNFFLCLTNYSAALILLPMWLWLRREGYITIPGTQGWGYFLLAAFFLLLSRELYFYAYSKIDMAQVTVFSALTPIYTLLTGYWFLHEIPGLRTTCGIMIVTLAIYSIFLPAAAGKSLILSLQPFKCIAGSIPVLCGFLSTIPTAFGTVYQKKALFSMDIASFSLSLFLMIGTAALLLECVRSSPRSMLSGIKVARRKDFWWIGLLLVITHVTFAPLLLAYHSAVALTLQRCSIIFQIVLAYFFLGQKDDIGRRIIAGVIIVLGLALLWNPG